MKRIFPILSFALCSLLLLLQITSVITVGVLNDMAKVLSCSIEVLPEGGYAMVTDPALWVAERESNRIARRRCIFASFGVLSLARFVSCCAKSHQNLSKMHSPAGVSSFDAADLFESKSFSRRAYRQYVQGERCRNRRNLHVKNQLGSTPVRLSTLLSYWWIWGSALLCVLLCLALSTIMILRHGNPGVFSIALSVPLAIGQGVLAVACSFGCPDKFAFDSSVMTFIWSIPDAFHIEMPVTSISNISAALGDALPILYATGAMLALALCLTELLRLILSKKAVGHETA